MLISGMQICVINHSLCRITSYLGSGQFGSVDKGVWRSGATVKEVAVKTLTDSANIVKFLQEAAIMAQFRHPNVVTLYGVVSRGKPVSYGVIAILVYNSHCNINHCRR